MKILSLNNVLYDKEFTAMVDNDGLNIYTEDLLPADSKVCVADTKLKKLYAGEIVLGEHLPMSGVWHQVVNYDEYDLEEIHVNFDLV